MRRIIVTIVAIGALLSALAPAQAWPDRPVRFIVPLGPGAGVDVTARLFADRLSARWGQPVVVENRPGADGIVAINAFLSADDDHVLLFAPTSSFSSHEYQHEKLPYQATSLAPIARVTNTIVALAVPASLKVDSIKDLMTLAKSEPGKLNWASATATNEFLFEGYLMQSGLQMAKVPYRNTVSAINDLAEGRIQVYVGAYAIMRPQLQTGKVKALAVTNQERAKGAPTIPTMAEAGFPALTFNGLVGIFGPLKMPEALRERIAGDVRQAAQDPEIVAKLVATGQNVSPGSPSEFAQAYAEQRQQVAEVAKVLGLKAAR